MKNWNSSCLTWRTTSMTSMKNSPWELGQMLYPFFLIKSHCKIAYQENDMHRNNVFFLQTVVIKKASFKLKHYREPWKVILVHRTVCLYYIYRSLRMSGNCVRFYCKLMNFMGYFLAQHVHVSRRNEVCFKFAQWRLTGNDGQLGITDLMLRNFV